MCVIADVCIFLFAHLEFRETQSQSPCVLHGVIDSKVHFDLCPTNTAPHSPDDYR